MTLPDPHQPAQAPAQPPQRVFRSMAEAVAAAPAHGAAWPMLPRTEERLLQVVWARSLLFGKCYTGQVGLGEAVGRCFPGSKPITDRWVRTLVKRLHRAHWLRREQTVGETDLLRVVTPAERARSHAPARTPEQPRLLGRGKPRNSTSGDPGTPVPPNKRNTNTLELGGTPPPAKPAPKTPSPLFDPIDLRAAQFRLGAASVCEAVQRLFQQGAIGRVKTPARRLPRPLLDAQLSKLGILETVRLVFPQSGGGAYVVDLDADDLLKLEFYP